MSLNNIFKQEKYKNVRIRVAGRSFQSKGEASCFNMLELMERAGEISELRCQTQVYLTKAKIIYKPDFTWKDNKSGRYYWGEYKGFETPEWRIKRRLWQHYGPGPLVVYKQAGPRIKTHEIIEVIDYGTDCDTENAHRSTCP